MLKPRPLSRHEACDCPRATHRHGERTTYVVHKCRCDHCRAASTDAMRTLRRAHLYGRHWLVDAEPTRQHLRWLSAQGMGWKTAARSAGVATSTVYSILYGKHLDDPDHPEHRPPRKQVSRAVADRILAVQPVLADGAVVDATGTRRRIQALVARGWSLSKLAYRLNILPSNFHLHQDDRSAVTEGTRKAVAALYEELWDQEPPEGHHRDKIAAARARRYAQERRWSPPMAWDNDTIDNPNAQPATGTDVKVDKAEELRWVLAQYESPSHAAERLGISRGTLQARMDRWGVDYPPRMAAWVRDNGRAPRRKDAAA